MQQDAHETLAVFRVWKDKQGGVLALFPEISAVPYRNLCLSYEHLGQHGSACYYGCLKRTRPATWEEWHPLYIELTQLGYRIKQRNRWNRRTI